MEVEDGIAKARLVQARQKSDRLLQWLETVLHIYSAQILPLNVPTARLVGVLSDRARDLGQVPGLADLAMAATA